VLVVVSSEIPGISVEVVDVVVVLQVVLDSGVATPSQSPQAPHSFFMLAQTSGQPASIAVDWHHASQRGPHRSHPEHLSIKLAHTCSQP
jgi:hypothetical protein